jgi:hypothetical protein
VGHICVSRSCSIVSRFIPFLNYVFSSSRNFVPTMYINGSLVEWQLCERVTHKCVHFLVNMLFDFVMNIFKISFLLLFVGINDIPVGGEHTCIEMERSLAYLGSLLMLIVESLNGSADIIVTSNTLLYVSDILLISLFLFLIVQWMKRRWNKHGEDRCCLAQRNCYILLKVLNRQFLVLFGFARLGLLTVHI